MQIFLNGAISGLTIGLLSLAFTVVYLPTGVFHLALGGLYPAVSFIFWACLKGGWGLYFAIILSTLIGLFLCLLFEIFNHYPLEKKNASFGVHFVSSLGINIVLIQIIVLIWGNEPKQFRDGPDQVFAIGDILITRSQILCAFVAIALLIIFYFWLRKSNLGLQFRALSENSKEFALKGYNIRYLRLVAFGISGILCSTASFLVSNDIGFDPHGGLAALTIAIVAMIIGGRLSFCGPVLGGLIIGIIRTEATWFLSERWEEVATFLLFALFLLIIPNGLLGRKLRLEAEG